MKEGEELERRVRELALDLAAANEKLEKQAGECERLKRSLEESDQKFRVIFDSASDPILIRDMESGLFIEVNRAFTERLGYSRDELLDMSPLDIDTPEFAKILHSRANEIREKGSMVFETEQVTKEGRIIPTEINSKFVTYKNKPCILSIARDITERKRAELELKKLNEELDAYAHTVSHDLKGPLNTMKITADTLQKAMKESGRAGGEREIDFLIGTIQDYARKAAVLAEDMLVLAEAGQKPRKVEVVDVGVVVDRIIEENAGIIGERSAKVVVEEELGGVVASPTHVYQLFSNLLRNCVLHCDSSSPVIEVRRLDEGDERGHRFLVRDNGSGIPDEDLEHIFTPFFKGETGSTGIGLATVDKIVDLYGGSMSAYNDGGACFEFVIRDYEE